MAAEPVAGKWSDGGPGDREEDRRRWLLHGPATKVLLSLAMPTIGVLLAQTVVGIAETFYVSQLGTDALVGVSVVFPAWMLMTMISAGGIGNGVASAVARALGSGSRAEADSLVFHAVVIATILGGIFYAGVRSFGGALFSALGAQGQALVQAEAYSFWLFLSAVPIWTVNLCSAALRGAGNVRVPALVSLAGVVVLVGLSPLLIFGLGSFAGFGIAGAGIAVTLFYSAAGLLLLRYLYRGRSGLTLRQHRWSNHRARDILSVGLMASISAAQLNLAVMVLTAFAGTFGSASLAGYGIGSRLDYLFIPILFGLGSAVLTLVGTAIGAGNLVRAKAVARIGVIFGASFTGLVGLVMVISPSLWLRIFTSDQRILAEGAIYLRNVGPFFAATGATFILGFVSQAAKRPGWTTFAGTVRLLVAGLGGWLAVSVLGLPFSGLAAVVVLGQLAAAGISIFAFAKGSFWKS